MKKKKLRDQTYFNAIEDARPILDTASEEDKSKLLKHIESEWKNNVKHKYTKQGRFEASMLRGENVIPETAVDHHASTPFNEMCNRIDAEYYAYLNMKQMQRRYHRLADAIQTLSDCTALQETLFAVYTYRERRTIIAKLGITGSQYDWRLNKIRKKLESRYTRGV